jgi:nitroimidazol reductase NimA-like FMN-containing flavoprotein (pyridoxamine 5'-phosphate oxidase superfamily)
MYIPDYTPPQKIGRLNEDELADFLAQPWNARLATVTPDNMPYIVPVWYEFDPDERVFYLVARGRSEYVQHILQNSAVALHIADDLHIEHTRAFVEGTAEILTGPLPPNEDEEMRRITLDMIRKYMGEEGIKYADRTLSRPRYLIKVIPRRWTSWTGQEWAARYREE